MAEAGSGLREQEYAVFCRRRDLPENMGGGAERRMEGME